MIVFRMLVIVVAGFASLESSLELDATTAAASTATAPSIVAVKLVNRGSR